MCALLHSYCMLHEIELPTDNCQLPESTNTMRDDNTSRPALDAPRPRHKSQPFPRLLPFSHHHSCFSLPFGTRIAPSYQCNLTESVSAALLSEKLSATKLFPSGSGPFSTGVLSRGPVDLFFSCIATSPRIFFLLIRSLLQSSRGTGLNWPSVLIFTWIPNRGITLLSFFLLSFCPITLHHVSAPYCFRSSAL